MKQTKQLAAIERLISNDLKISVLISSNLFFVRNSLIDGNNAVAIETEIITGMFTKGSTTPDCNPSIIVAVLLENPSNINKLTTKRLSTIDVNGAINPPNVIGIDTDKSFFDKIFVEIILDFCNLLNLFE